MLPGIAAVAAYGEAMSGRSAVSLPILGAVMAGGAVGVALRQLLLLPFAGVGEVSVLAVSAATMGVNVLGSFALGAVAGGLGDRHPVRRAFIGTGVLGGFTTYSAFAVQSADLFSGAPLVGIALAVAAVVLGLVAAALGMRITAGPATVSPPL